MIKSAAAGGKGLLASTCAALFGQLWFFLWDQQPASFEWAFHSLVFKRNVRKKETTLNIRNKNQGTFLKIKLVAVLWAHPAHKDVQAWNVW